MCSRLAAVRDVASGGEQWRSLHQEEEEERRRSYIQESEELDRRTDWRVAVRASGLVSAFCENYFFDERN